MAKTLRRDSAKEATWRERLARHRKSGDSVRAWCHRHGVKETVFHWWRRELARRDAEPSSPVRLEKQAQAVSFVAVRLSDEPARAGDGQIEIDLADGRRVRVTSRVNRQMLADVLEVLSSTNSTVLERRTC